MARFPYTRILSVDALMKVADANGPCVAAILRTHRTPYTDASIMSIFGECFFLCVSATAVGWGKIEGDRMALDKGPSHSVEYRNAIFGRQIYISPIDDFASFAYFAYSNFSRASVWLDSSFFIC